MPSAPATFAATLAPTRTLRRLTRDATLYATRAARGVSETAGRWPVMNFAVGDQTDNMREQSEDF